MNECVFMCLRDRERESWVGQEGEKRKGKHMEKLLCMKTQYQFEASFWDGVELNWAQLN